MIARPSPLPPILSRRFLKAWLLATLASLVVASLTLPLVMAVLGHEILNAEGLPANGAEATLATLLLLPFGIIIGGVLALPSALLMGIGMRMLIERFVCLNRAAVWGCAGLLFALPATLLVGSVYPLFPDRALFTAWLGLAGFAGGIVMYFRMCRPD
jgi:hypothetical protein